MVKLITAALARSDDPEQIDNCASVLGKSKQRLRVFESVYSGQKKKKSIADIMIATDLSEKQVRSAVTYLSDHHMCIVEGRGGNTKVSKDDFCRKYRDKIIRAATNREYRLSLPTKRHRNGIGSLSSVLPRSASTVSRGGKSSKRLTVAFLTTNPDRDLRTDLEYRAVSERLRESVHRDRILLENVAAASLEDLLRVMNNMQPAIVHFSGHGNRGLIVFDSESIDGEAVQVEFELLKGALESTNNPPRLVVLNSCFGSVVAEDLLGEVEAVVGMNNSIDDVAAAMFSRQFYASLFSGQPADKALEQGRIVLRAAGFADADFPQLILKDGAEVNELTFV